MSSDTEELKARYNIIHAWADEGLPGNPSKCGHSPFREDRKPSFSVFSEGMAFKDHATGETGDVFKFIQLARNCDFRESVKIVRKRSGSICGSESANTSEFRKPFGKRFRSNFRSKISVPKQSSASPEIQKPKFPAFRKMPAAVAEIWSEGSQYLARTQSAGKEIDTWRKWPEGTTQTLAEDGLISFPHVTGQRGAAFAVHYPTKWGPQQAGFHFRNPQSGNWQFFPNASQHGQSARPLPFVLGHGYLPSAHLIIVTEGAWDCISWAAHAGWLDTDTSWPEGIVIFGILGANNWRALINHYEWAKSCPVALVPDNDPAGNSWKGDFLSELRARSRKVSVFQPEENDLSDQLSGTTTGKRALLYELTERAAS